MSRDVARPEPPACEVGNATGLVGAVALALLVLLALATEMSVPAATLLFLAGTALPMVAWALLAERVHRRESTGLDPVRRRPMEEVVALTRTKMLGLAATFALLGLGYFAIRTYGGPGYTAYLAMVAIALPLMLAVAPFYIGFVTARMREPHDGLWHFGRLVLLRRDGTDMEAVKDHLRCWAIKGFFLAFMVSVMPGSVSGVLLFDLGAAASDPVAAIIFVVRLAFLFDVCFGTIGYILTMRPLDAHIRSANPYLSAWVAALVCYPPFALMGAGGPLDYRTGAAEWTEVLAGMDALLVPWGIAIAALAVVYAWATVVFGLRFSNLTHRGIITAGPYRYVRHPAYVAKNLLWWLVHIPFLSAASAEEAVRNSLLLLSVNAIYVLRARTEERHLMADPRYRAYAAWIAEHGLFARLVGGRGRA